MGSALLLECATAGVLAGVITGCSERPASSPARSLPPALTQAPSRAEPVEPSSQPEPHVDARSLGDCSSDGWCWENPLKLGGTPRAVWGTAPNDVWAAGDVGTMLHFDGRSWSPVKLEENWTTWALWGSGSNDVWAAGHALIHWDGRAWSGHEYPWSVAALGATDDGKPWVANSRGTVNRWEGSTWRERVPDSCRAMGCGWPVIRTAGGGTLALLPSGLYWDGTSLQKTLPSPVGRTFGGTRESHVALVRRNPYVQVWRGSRWVPLPTPDAAPPRDPRLVLQAIWGATDDDFWVVGEAGVIFHWDGTGFTAFDSGTKSDLRDVWGTSRNDVWAVGPSALLHWDGREWKNSLATATTADLNDVWGAGDCNAWAVGSGGAVLHRDCRGWKPVASGVTVDLFGVAGTSSTDVWIVGAGGTLLHSDGEHLVPFPSPFAGALYSVWGASATDVWAVGEGGAVLHFDGRAWSRVTSSATQTLRSVRGSASNQVLAAGDGGTLLAWNGVRWSDRPGPRCITGNNTADGLRGIWFRDVSDVWLVCETQGPRRGVLEAWIGKALTGNYADVGVIGAEAWTVGQYRFERRTEQGDWAPGATTPRMMLRALGGDPARRLWAVGEHGVILSKGISE